MIKDIIESKNMTVYAVSKNSGIPYSTLSDIVSGKTAISNVSAEVLYRLSCALGMSMESLYLGKRSHKIIYIYNEGRAVYVESSDFKFQYMGPKNLVAFKRVNSFVSGCVYVDTYFSKRGGEVFLEEDYIDIEDLCNEYGVSSDVLENASVQIGKPERANRDRLIDNSILVSDYMAILESDIVSDSAVVEVTNIVRMNARMQLRLKDYAVLSTNMSRRMQKRAVEAVQRNIAIIERELEKRAGHA